MEGGRRSVRYASGMNPSSEERPPRLHLVHCTSVERGRSIVTEGLKPGTEERCNYDCNRWLPLDGVYLSVSGNQIDQYRRAHDLRDCALVLVEADPDTLLPDEDVIDVLLAMAFKDNGGRAWDDLSDGEEIPPSGDPFWKGVRDRFVRLAGRRSDAVLRPDDLDELVDWWADFEFFGEGGDVDPFEWSALKDRIVRAFPRMEGLALHERSKRHPGPIGFDGSTRIAAVVEVIGGDAFVVRGVVPDEARNLVAAMIGDDVFFEEKGNDA